MLHSAQQLWDTVLGQLQLQVARTSYETWLRDTAGLSLDGQVLTVGVPTPFAAEWLERRLYALLQRSVEDVAKQPLQVRFQVVPRGTQAHQDLRAHADGSPQEPEGKGSPEPGSYNDE
ncbi:MAG: hypothetical protein HY535_01260 [Chloroflexi bacterium]|nr:hypothetical protein [Chloroflexota bacterium]